MNKNLILIDFDKNIQDALEIIILNKSRTIFISKNNKVVGTISEGDILRALFEKKNLQTPLKNIINKNFKYLDKDSHSLNLAKKIFKKYSVLVVPVINEKGALVSVYNIEDVI